eukprot:538767_1
MSSTNIPLLFVSPYTHDKQQRNNKKFKYKCHSKIGQGSQGSVFKIKRNTSFQGVQNIDGNICCKEMITKNWNNKKWKRFNTEMKSLSATKNNNNLLRPFEVYIPRNTLYMVLARGVQDVQAFAEGFSQGKVPPEFVYDISIQSINGLQAIHSVNMIHRDLKPSNMIIFKQGNKINVKLTDFETSITVNDTHQSAIQSNWGNEAFTHPLVVLGAKCVPYVEVDYYSLLVSIFCLSYGMVGYGKFVEETLCTNKIV